MTLDTVLDRIDTDLDAALDRLMTLLRIPSISTDPAYKDACQKAADWLVADLASLGVTAEARQTPGHPMVVGHVGEGSPHLWQVKRSCRRTWMKMCRRAPFPQKIRRVWMPLCTTTIQSPRYGPDGCGFGANS